MKGRRKFIKLHISSFNKGGVVLHETGVTPGNTCNTLRRL